MDLDAVVELLQLLGEEKDEALEAVEAMEGLVEEEGLEWVD